MNSSNCGTNKSRFCYNYTPPGAIQSCCPEIVCATNQFISSISSLSDVVNNNTRTTEQSLLLAKQQQCYQDVNRININSTIQYTLANTTTITNDLQSQLQEVRNQRYQPYQPYIPPVIPLSVIQLQKATVNVGVPMSFFTIADCKGSQSVTT
jgi:hypothetical protein